MTLQIVEIYFIPRNWADESNNYRTVYVRAYRCTLYASKGMFYKQTGCTY